MAKPRASYDWLKSYIVRQLDNELNQLNPVPDFGSIKLWLHQKVAFILALELHRFMFFMDMGSGKTLTVLALLLYRKQRDEKPRAIVFVPYITSVETWVEEVSKHASGLKCVPLVGTTKQNLNALSGDGDLFVICYQSAVAMVSGIMPDHRTGKRKWVINAEQIRNYFAGFDTLILDEVHRCKTVSSLTYRMCRAISAQTQYTLGLTGTPFGRDLSDLWPQFNLIDFGETLGPTLGFYRQVFFTQKKNYWGGYEYTFNKKLLPDLQRIIKHSSISYSIDELRSMPPKEYVHRHLLLPPEYSGYAKKAIAELNEAIKGKNLRQIESNYLQLRQLASGFMTLHGDDAEKLHVSFDQNPKLEALSELLEDLPPDCKAVVFHHFIHTGKIISAELDRLKLKHARIWGGAKDPIGELRKFKSQKDCRVLVINIKSGSASLNLQNASYLIFFEQPDSPIDRKQAEARVWRPGQARRVFIYDLLMKSTADHRLHKANIEGKNLLDELLHGAQL